MARPNENAYFDALTPERLREHRDLSIAAIEAYGDYKELVRRLNPQRRRAGDAVQDRELRAKVSKLRDYGRRGKATRPRADQAGEAAEPPQEAGEYVPGFENVVEDPDRPGWRTRLKCNLCQADATEDNVFFKGIKGMAAHYRQSHREQLRERADLSNEAILRNCKSGAWISAQIWERIMNGERSREIRAYERVPYRKKDAEAAGRAGPSRRRGPPRLPDESDNDSGIGA